MLPVFMVQIYAVSITIRIVLGFMLLALIWRFDFSPFMVLIIAILNDGLYFVTLHLPFLTYRVMHISSHFFVISLDLCVWRERGGGVLNTYQLYGMQTRNAIRLVAPVITAGFRCLNTYIGLPRPCDRRKWICYSCNCYRNCCR